jgi:ELWxxDGT repeat protein
MKIKGLLISITLGLGVTLAWLLGVVLMPLAAPAAETSAAQATPMVPYLVKDIHTWTQDSDPDELVEMNGELYFVADDGDHGLELWKSDGAESHTELVKDIHPGREGSSPSELTVMNGELFFRADDGRYGVELWKSDGTEGGTERVRDINDDMFGSGSSLPTHLTVVDGTLFCGRATGRRGAPCGSGISVPGLAIRSWTV